MRPASPLALLRRALPAIAAALAGCAAAPRVDLAGAAPVELTDVPFFAQTDYQCGPAALATILAYEGLPVTADDLVPAVYVEGLRGSLQAELLAATRRHGLVPYPLEQGAEALVAEIEAGKPVLVLQNLGLPRFPVWHYAVVVGFDGDRVLLRSGTERRRSERTGRFLRSWQRAGQWAFVAASPDDPPRSAEPERWIRALADAVRMLPSDTADAAFDAAARRWPEHPIVLFAAAARDGAAGRWQSAARRYESLLALAPGDAAARNNLANALAEGGCLTEALRQARAAERSVEPDSPLRPAIEDTLETLAAAAAANAGEEPTHCGA